MKVKFGHLEIFTPDPQALSRFYLDMLGFELVTVQEGMYYWVKSGQLEILFRPGQAHESAASYEQSRIGFVLYSESVEVILAKLDTYGVAVMPAADSDKCYTFTDPDGNWLQLVDPADH